MLFESDQDRQAVLAAMKEIEQQPTKTVSLMVELRGQPTLVGLAYLPEIDWYEVTLLDVNTLLPLQNFVGMLLVFALSLLVALIAFNVLLGRVVLSPSTGWRAPSSRYKVTTSHPKTCPRAGPTRSGI